TVPARPRPHLQPVHHPEEARRRHPRRDRTGPRRRPEPGRDDPPARPARGKGTGRAHRRRQRPARAEHRVHRSRQCDLEGHPSLRQARARHRHGRHGPGRARPAPPPAHPGARQPLPPRIDPMTAPFPHGTTRNRGAAPVLFLVAALALAGCASTRGLAPASAPIDADALIASRSLDAQSPATFPQVDWWRAFGDPQLDALIEEALAGTPSLAAADARLRKAVADAGLADALRKPTLGASAQATGVQIPETFVEPPMGGDFKASTVLMLDFKYSPDLWGGQRAKYEAAVGQARAAAVDAQAARLALAANIA